MFDIFNEPEQPKLYIADITVLVRIPSRFKNVKYEERKINLTNHPIVLINGVMPSLNMEKRFFRSVHNNYVKKGDFDKIIFKISKIDNLKFSSNLMYKFDFSVN
jgi:hypothetical protein